MYAVEVKHMHAWTHECSHNSRVVSSTVTWGAITSSKYNTEWPLSRQRGNSWQFHDISL